MKEKSISSFKFQVSSFKNRYLWMAVGILLLSFFLPSHGLGLSLCPFRFFTGLPCFGCGLTRSLCSISHWNISASVVHHPFGWVLYIFLIGIILFSLFPIVRKKITQLNKDKPHFVFVMKCVMGGMFALFGTLRLFLYML